MKQKTLTWPIRRWAWIGRDGEVVLGNRGQTVRVMRAWAAAEDLVQRVEIRPVPKKGTA